MRMLEKAYALRSNDPYITDSIGWAYYLIENYTEAEKYIKKAVELMPEDPTVNDHYGDILWKLNSCLLYTSPSPRDRTRSRMPSSA